MRPTGQTRIMWRYRALRGPVSHDAPMTTVSISTATPSTAASGRWPWITKNALVDGTDRDENNWDSSATPFENRNLGGIDPRTWLMQTLTKLANGHEANSVGELMPWHALVRRPRVPLGVQKARLIVNGRQSGA